MHRTSFVRAGVPNYLRPFNRGLGAGTTAGAGYISNVIQYWSTPIASLSSDLQLLAGSLLTTAQSKLDAAWSQTQTAYKQAQDAYTALFAAAAAFPALNADGSEPYDDANGTVAAARAEVQYDLAASSVNVDKLKKATMDLVQIGNVLTDIRTGQVAYAVTQADILVQNISLQTDTTDVPAANLAAAGLSGMRGLGALGEPITLGIGVIVVIGLVAAVTVVVAIEINTILGRAQTVSAPAIQSLVAQAKSLSAQAQVAAAAGDQATADQLNQQAAAANAQATALTNSAVQAGSITGSLSSLTSLIYPIAIVAALVILGPPILKMISDRKGASA